MHDVLLVIRGVLLAGAGQLIMRHLRKDRATEQIDRADKLLDIRDKMARQGATFDDVRSVEDALLAKKQVQRNIEDRLRHELSKQEAQDPTAYIPQQSMNRWAAHRAEEMDAKLRGVLVEIETWMSSKERKQLEKAQEAWEKFREEQTELAGLEFEGGSIRTSHCFWRKITRASSASQITLSNASVLLRALFSMAEVLRVLAHKRPLSLVVPSSGLLLFPVDPGHGPGSQHRGITLALLSEFHDRL